MGQETKNGGDMIACDAKKRTTDLQSICAGAVCGGRAVRRETAHADVARGARRPGLH